jgi:N-acyl-L-homoserine lactone synthetase
MLTLFRACLPAGIEMNAIALACASEAASQSRFSQGASQLLNKIDCRIIRSAEETAAVGHLRYQAYVGEGAIEANPQRSFIDPHDEDSNAWVLGLYLGDELVSSIRLHIANKDYPNLPSLAVFADLLDPWLAAGKTIIDPTRFVTDQRLSRLYPALPYVTLRLCWLAAEYFDADHLLAAVRVEHQAFYQRLFYHRPICGPRRYPSLNKPITLMTVDYREVADRIYRRFPFVRSTFFERRMLFERGQPCCRLQQPEQPKLSGPVRTLASGV